MSDELRRRFQDKIQSRALHPVKGSGTQAVRADDALAPEDIRIRAIEHGAQPDLGSVLPRLARRGPFVRMTLDLGGRFLQEGPLPEGNLPHEFRALCPGLPLHRCELPGGIDSLIAPDTHPAVAQDTDLLGDGGMNTAHLIEHVALDLEATVRGSTASRGATCEYHDRPDRFDVFLECAEAPLGRTVAMLATAAVRDLRTRPGRLDLHRRCRDLLSVLARSPGPLFVPEDVARWCSLSPDDALAGLDALVRLGYLEALRAPLVFSSSTGTLFRRAEPGPAPAA